MTSTMLEQLGFSVRVETASLKALKTFSEEPERFDLAILDHQIDELLSVLKLAERFKRIRPDFPMVLYTGRFEEFSAEQPHPIFLLISKFFEQKRFQFFSTSDAFLTSGRGVALPMFIFRRKDRSCSFFFFMMWLRKAAIWGGRGSKSPAAVPVYFRRCRKSRYFWLAFR